MSDLYLTEQEKKFFAESEAPKEIKSFSDWSGENNASISDPQSFLNYADFMRNELGESYDARSEIEIQNGLRLGLSTIEGMTEETIEQSLAPKETDFDTKLNVVYSSLGVDDPDRQALLDYRSYTGLKEGSMLEQAEEIVNSRLDQTKEELVASNQLPLAFVQDEEGNRKLLISDIATDMPIQKAIKASQFGGVSFNPEDVYAIQSNLRVIPDTGVTVYKTKELMEISKEIVELSKSDESVAEFVDGTALRMAREKDTTAESVSRAIGDTFSEFLGAIGVADDEMDKKRAKVKYASLLEIDEAVEYITDRLNETGASYKPSDVRDAYEALVVQNGFSKGMFALRAEGKEVTENIINTKLGAQINPAVFVNDELFEKSIAAHPELSDQTKKLFVESRKLVLEDQFENYNKVLEESSYADEWSEALLKGRRAGKKDADILTEFTADDEVFSELGARTGGIAASVWDSVASLVYLAPAVFGSDWGKEGLQDIAKDQANRRQIAQMFGADFGVGQDVMEAIAPMLVDIGATFLLSSATAGAGGVAYLSAKSGAKLTTAGMIKGITSNVLRTGSTDAAESVARTALARDLIRGSLDDATAAIKSYNNTVAQKMGLAVGTFVPAASRSSAMSYGSLYNQLKASDPNMSDEEAHDRAMGFAMTSGVITGIITSAFSAIGRGGVEDALLKGMNFREAKSLLSSFANTGGITDDALKSAMGKVLRDSLKKHSGQFLKTGRKMAKNTIDESLEEGIDQLVNSYVEDVALDQTTPLAEKWQQTVHAAMVGGVLGAGVPAVQAGASRIGVTPMDRAAQAFRLRKQYIQDVAANLKENGSPITAAVVEQVISQRKRTIPTPSQREAAEAETVDEMGQAKEGLERAEQDLTTLLQEQEQLKSIEEPDEEQVNRLSELNTLVDEKNKEIIGFGDTIQSLESRADERVTETPKRGLDLLKELEGVDPAEVRYQIERLRMKKNLVGKAEEIPESKSYARQVSREKIQFDAAPSTSENLPVIQRKAIALAGMGYPQDVTYKQDFGLPIYTDADAATFSDYVASAAYTIYPTVKAKKPNGGSVFKSPTGKEAFNPNIGKRGIVSGFLDENGSGVFDNDPVVIAEMLRANVPVSVPKSFALSGLNPSIIIDPDNNVVDVVAPAAEGNILESKVSSLEENKELYYNNVEASRLAAIPFKKVELPDGVSRFDTSNGATTEGDFTTVAQIKNSLNAFLAELQKTGDERNVEAHSRMEPLSATEDTEAQLQAFIDAREKFVFNARMFELREALRQDPTDKVGKFLSRVNLKKEAAAKRVLPLISIDKAGDLSNDAIIETFVDQYAVNNPDLSGNTPPSFASVLSNSTRNFAVQKDTIENRYREDAEETLPIDGDIIQTVRKRSDFVDNFGRKPDGGAATPEEIAAMMVTSIDAAVDAINSDQKLRVTVEDFVTDNVFDGTPQMQEVVRNLSPKDLFGFLSSWVVSSNGRVRKSVSDFVSTLESGELFRGIELRDALIATRFTTRPDGLGIANKTAVDEFQSLFADFTGELLTVEQARNTMLAIDGALRTRLSKAKITDKRRAEITQQNDATITKLGLKSGDPESVVTALKNIAKGMGSKNEQLVAKLLLEDTNFIRNNVRFVIGGGNIDIAGKYIKAINGNHIVFINRTSGSGRGLINTLLEEYIHAFTSDTVAASDAVLAKDKNKASARRKLEKIFNNISRSYDADVAGGGVPNSVVADGLVNLDEFIAKFFLADKFQKYVKDLVGPNSFDGIIDSIVTIFPKVTPSEKTSFVAAFKDVLDLGKRGRKHTEPDAKAIGSSAADRVLFSAPISSSPTAALDAEYLAAVEAGDMSKAQAMVNDAAKRAGYNRKGVRFGFYVEGVPLPPSNSTEVNFGPGYYVAEDAKLEETDSGGVSVSSIANKVSLARLGLKDEDVEFRKDPVFVKAQRPFETVRGGNYSQEVENFIAAELDLDQEIAKGQLIAGTFEANTWPNFASTSAKLIKEQRIPFDSTRGATGRKGMTSELVVPNASQIKSAAPVTYDSNGNVIPLSQRFDETKSSILFSAPTEATVEPNILEGVPEAERGLLSQGIALIRSVLPPSITIRAAEFDTGGSLAYVSKDESTIFIDPKVLVNLLANRDLDSLSTKNIIGVQVNEEIGHIAGFNALTQEEVDNFVESLSDSDYQKIITEYTQNSSESVAEGLRSQLASEDADAVLNVKRQLAEEKLRMHLQKVTRGFTTEEDVRFWKKKPSLFAMLKRYFAGVIRRFAANRKPLGGAGGAALNKMISEMRAIEAGFARKPNSMEFDPNNPEATYQMQLNGAKGIDDVLYSAPIGAIVHVYERESAKFNKLREEGQIIVNQDLDQFAGQSILLHQPDTAFAGEVTMDGETIVTGQGGVYYPVMFSDQNYFWASTRSAAEGLAESLNEISRQNGGKILMGLTSADVEKLFSSTSMSNGVINFFLNLTKNPRFYGLNKATFNRILVEASKVTTKKGKVFSKKLKVSDGLEKNIEEMRILLDSEQSTFDLRAAFVESLASGVASIYDVPPLTKIKKITDPKEIKRIDDLKEKSFRIASLLLGGNEYANTDIKKGKLSKSSILQGLGDMLTEPFVKTFQQLNKKTGNIYAVLELDGEVESVRAEEHESYKYTVISKSGEKPKVHVLGNSYYWADVTVDVDTNQPIPESKQLSYYPTFGVSNTKLKLTKADEKAKEKSLPLLFSAPVSGLTGDYAPIVDLLEVPEVEIDRLGKPKNGLLNYLSRIVAGELPEAFRRIIENRNFFRTAIEDDVVKFKKAMDKIVIKTYGSFENAPTDLIATAQGYRFQSLVSDENLEQIEDAYEASLDDIDARLEAEEIDAETARDERKIALTTKTKKIDQAYAEGLRLAEEARDEALRKISLDSPEMASFIIDIRQRYIIPMQKKLIANGLDETDIGIKISQTGEVYLTRAYRMFTDSTYLDTLKEDESWPDKRDAALKFFRKQFIRDNARKIRDELRAEGTLITYQEAKQKAKRNLDRRNEINPNRSYEQEALDTFLESYSPKDSKSSGSSDSGIKMAMDNLKRRKDLPKEIRDLLGEYGEETGTDLILRTYSTVANIAAQKTFLEGLKLTAETAGLMVSAETRIATEENRQKYANWIPVRPDNFASKADPLADMYIHPEFKESLDMTLKNSYVQEYAATSERLINGAFTLASKLSGKAMAAKTLGSVGFYFRNAIGNFVFGTSQGFFRYDKMLAGMSKASIDALFGLNGEVDPVVTELIGLGVMGDEIRAGVMRDLLNGKQTPAGIQKELENLMDKSKVSKPAKVLAAIEKKAQDLSAALDAAYKVAYYQHELNYIERSAAEGGEGSLYGKMSPTQRKREAARKVLMTAQSYSQAPPIITDFTKSPLGLMFAPFLRFKAETFRIPFNTYKLGLEELRSGDPVMRQRGILRMSSMTGVLGILSSALPMIMASVSGIGDDENEDEAIREGLPEYLRGHTFYYFFWDGKLKSFDATFLNPFAGTMDPTLRAIDKIRRGQYSEAGAAFALGYVKDQFLDTQILANAAINAANNTNQSTGKPIWNRGVDGPIDVATKLFSYVASEAYAPRIGSDFVKGLETQSLEGMLGQLAKGAIPARTYDVDLQGSFERFLLGHGKRFANVKSELDKLRSSQPLSDDSIREIIDDNIEARRRMNYELMRVARGFNSLGLGADKVINTMHDKGVGKQRTKLLSYGFMDRPSIKFIAESLLQERSKEFGPERLQKIVDYYRTKNRYIPVSPVTESD